MKIIRRISWFDKQNENLVGDYDFELDLHILKEIFKPPKDDPLMYNPYWVREEEAQKLTRYVDFSFDFSQYDYDLGCFQVRE